MTLSKVVTGTIGSIVAASLTSMCLFQTSFDSGAGIAILALGIYAGSIVGLTVAFSDCMRPRSNLHSITLGGMAGLAVYATLLWIAVTYINGVHFGDVLDTANERDVARLVLIGAASGLGYRTVVDHASVQRFIALIGKSTVGAIAGLAAYICVGNYLAGAATLLPHVLTASIGGGMIFGLIYSVVHLKFEPSPASSLATGTAVALGVLAISIYAGAFVGFSIASVVALVIAPFFVGGGAYLGWRLR